MNAVLWTRRAQRLHVASDRGTGPIVVLIHGVASSSSTFQNVLPLIDHSHRCITIDLLGSGESPMPVDSECTLDEHVAAVKRTIDSLQLHAPYTLVGHSLGALIAARLASRTPRNVERVVLVSPPIFLTPEELNAGAGRREHRHLVSNEAFALRYAECVEPLPSMARAVDDNECSSAPSLDSLEHSIKSQTTLSDLAAVRVPVEVILGSMDDFHSEGLMQIVSDMANVEVHRVAPRDHLIGRRLARVVATAIGRDETLPRITLEDHAWLPSRDLIAWPVFR
ncbi:MAG TPA: alpha/beta hydrolase [Galbitalea sp.]